MNSAILDCTLRDGGYYTEWDFSDELVAEYLSAMQALKIDYVELGYRSLATEGFRGKYAYTAPYVFDWAQDIAPDVKMAIMVDQKSVNRTEFEKLMLPCQGRCHLVRLAVAPEKIAEAVPMIKLAKEMGFKVALNMMRFHQIEIDDEFQRALLEAEQDLDFLYLVDSYGCASPSETEAVFDRVHSISKSQLGFHGHDNMHLALANSIVAEKHGAMILDSTICGMGRGAGNLRTEALLAYLAAKHGRTVDFHQLGHVVSLFAELQEKYRWGNIFPYIVSGAYGLPQKDVMEWLGTRRYSVNAIVQALQNQNDNKQDNLRFPILTPTSMKEYDEILVIGGGPTLTGIVEELSSYLKSHPRTLLVFTSVTHVLELSEFVADAILCLAGSESGKIAEQCSESAVASMQAFVLPPYPRRLGTQVPTAVHDRTLELPKTFQDACNFDSPLAVALGVAHVLQHHKVSCVGLDGYDEGEMCHDLLNQENQAILDGFSNLGMTLESLTKTRYQSLIHNSIYAKVQHGFESRRDHSSEVSIFPLSRKAAG